MLGHLPNAPTEIPHKIIDSVIKTYKFDREKCLENFEFVIAFMEENDIHMPCIQLANMFKYYSNAIKVIYTREACLELRLNPIIRMMAVAHDSRLEELGKLREFAYV